MLTKFSFAFASELATKSSSIEDSTSVRIANSPCPSTTKATPRPIQVRCRILVSHFDRPVSPCDADLDDDDDDTIMRRVLAISQIEYVETLKKQRQPPKSDDPNGPSSSSDTHLL